MALPKTRTGKLSDLARHVVLPTGIATTGWPAVRDKCAEFGDLFDEWQDGTGRAILAKRADGIYAATVGGVVLSIPRQVAKTFLVGRICVALCLLFPNLTVLWTAHRTRTTTRTFQSLQRYVKRKKLWPHVLDIRTSHGEQEIAFRNGSVILFGAREQGFGRGFEEIDVEVFDEAQILTEKALEDMIAATNQSRHPHGALLFYMGTPPRPVDPGEAFTLKRTKALSGKSEDMVYIEFSADRGADPDDRKQWEKANPSYPTRTPLESMLRLRENLPSEESWLREALGIWDEDLSSRVIPGPAWEACLDAASTVEGALCFALDVSPDRSWSSIAASGTNADRLMHVEITSFNGVLDHQRGTDWVLPRLVDMRTRFPGLSVTIGAGSGAESLKPALESAGITVRTAPSVQIAAACGLFFDKVTTAGLRHLGQPELNAALVAARKQVEDGENAWKWGRKKSAGDITALYAATLALWAAVEAQNMAMHPINNIW